MRVVIVGAGPAGASLAFLLARRGIEVVLVERQSDFAREFRGEGLMPSGVDALAQMGLAAELDALPQAQVSEISIWLGPRRVTGFGIDDVSVPVPVPRFVSQPALLEMLVAQAGRHPSFELVRGATVRDVLSENARVAGVRIDGAGGSRDVRADFTFGCDGRASLVRKRTGLERERSAPVFDVVWCKLPLPDFMRGRARLCLGRGHLAVLLPAPDGRLQLGWVIQKGRFGELRRAGIEHWIGELAANVPDDVSAWIRAHAAEVTQPFLLDVALDRLEVWNAPGVLLVGDAAHAMSPVGAQGINIALRDALVAANQLGPALLRGASPAELDAAAARVAAERLPEVRAIQQLQEAPPRLILQTTPQSRLFMRWIFPALVRTGLFGVLFARVFPRFALGTTDVRLRF